MGLPTLSNISLYMNTACDRDVRVIDHGIVSLVRTAAPAGLNLYYKCRLGSSVLGTLYLQKYAWPTPFGERFAQIFYGDLYNDFRQKAVGGRVVIFSEDATHWHIGIWRDEDYYDLDAAQAGGSAATSAIWHGRTLITVDGTTNIHRAGVRGDVFTALPVLTAADSPSMYSITQVGNAFWVSKDDSADIDIYTEKDFLNGNSKIGTIAAPIPFRSMMFDGHCLWILNAPSKMLAQYSVKW